MLRALLDGSVFGESYGDGPLEVLALHGWARTHADFNGVLGAQAPGGPASALAPDLPGSGATPPPPAAWGSDEYAALVAEILVAEGVPSRGPVVVLGHSFGGRVALRLAADRPDLVGALVLTGAPVAARTGGGRRPAWQFRAVRSLRRAGLVGEDRLERARQRYGSADYRAAQGVMRAVLVRLLAERYEASLDALRCPVALVWGEDDAEVPPSVASAIAGRVPGATLSLVAGAGHLTPLSAPSQLRAAVDEARAADRGGGGAR